LGLLGHDAQAAPITISASNGSLAASATFEVVGGDLQITLTNTSTADVLVPADVLTAVFFDIQSLGALTPVSAVLGGSQVFYGAAPGDGIVGGEWAYVSGLVGAPGGATEGISSSGLGGVFGNPTFPGNNLAGPGGLDGLQYGILSAGDDTSTGNGGITGSGGLVKNSVVFTLSGIPGGFDPSALGMITNVSFQYGTALYEPNIRTREDNLVPEPGLLSLFGAALTFGGYRLRRRQA
jgi:hypothetical protein